MSLHRRLPNREKDAMCDSGGEQAEEFNELQVKILP